MVNKIEIQALLAKGLICAEVARKLGVSRQRIHQIVKANSLKVYKRFGPSQKVYKRYRLRQLPRPAGACAVTTPPTCPRCGQPIVPETVCRGSSGTSSRPSDADQASTQKHCAGWCGPAPTADLKTERRCTRISIS